MLTLLCSRMARNALQKVSYSLCLQFALSSPVSPAHQLVTHAYVDWINFTRYVYGVGAGADSLKQAGSSTNPPLASYNAGYLAF
jgi:hypothetical protein